MRLRFRKYLFLLLLFAAPFVYAEYNPYYDFLKAKFKDYGAFQNLKSLSGDIIYLEFPSVSGYLYNMKSEVPDTIWLKDKRPKKPKEGKHYNLQYVYKGIQHGTQYATPVREVNMKPFKLLAVNEVPGNTYSSVPGGFSFTLQDPETNERVFMDIDNSLPPGTKIYSNRINSEIDNLKKDSVYIKTGKGDIDYTVYSLSDGKVYLEVSPGSSLPNVKPVGTFRLDNPGASPVVLTYGGKSNNTDSKKLLSHAEYLQEVKKHEEAVEAAKVYEIDYTQPADTSYLRLVDPLPVNYVMGLTKRNAYVSQTVRPGSSPLGYNKTLPENTILIIADQISIRGTDYYKAALDGKPFFIKKEDVEVEKPEDVAFLASQPAEVRDALLKLAMALSLDFRAYVMNENYKKLKKYTDRGLVILGADVFDTSEYTEGTGVEFCIWNTSSKTIKYITFNYVGYNAVDDPVPNFGRTTLTLKGIGPVEPDYNGCYEDELVWWTDIVQYCELKSVVVEYTNKTTRTYKGKELEELPEELLEDLEYESPVEDFLPKYDN